MRTLSAGEVLNLWERGLAESRTEWPLSVLAAAHPDTSRADWISMPIGERDARLLELRERTFGADVAAVLVCPSCAAKLDVHFRTDQVRSGPPTPSSTSFTLTFGGGNLRFRLPHTRDLAEITQCGTVADARQMLLRRCVLEAFENGEPRTVEQLTAESIAVLETEMARLDPRAEVRLSASCPSCGQGCEGLFDIASFFWTELQAHARRLLRDVHAIATAYGWHEGDILAMSPARRNAYLELVGA